MTDAPALDVEEDKRTPRITVCAVCLETKCHCEFYRRIYPDEIDRRGVEHRHSRRQTNDENIPRPKFQLAHFQTYDF